MDHYSSSEQAHKTTKPADPLQDVPGPAFNHINDLLNLCSNTEIIISWMETVLYHRNSAVQNNDGEEASSMGPKRGFFQQPSKFPSTEAVKPRYTCHKCNETCGSAKEFRRHMEEKCELVRLWHCPGCSKIYHRAYHLRDHHKKRHGCDSRGHCNHLDNAVHYLPAKNALGCGYCLQWCDAPKPFITHLIKHFEQDLTEPRWNNTLSVHSLLQHPRFRTTWDQLCATRFGSTSSYMPSLAWDMMYIEQELRSLQYGISGQELKSCLARLLEKGIGLGQPPSRSFNVDSARASSFGPVFAGDTAWSESGYDIPGTDHFIIDTPNTLVNTEDIWANYTTISNSPNALNFSQWASTDPNCDLDSFGKEINLSDDFMDLTTLDNLETVATFSTTAKTYGSIYPPASMAESMTDNVEDIVMHSIPTEYPPPTTSNSDTCYFSPSIAATAQEEPVVWASDISLDFSVNDIDRLHPFNPTPPLPTIKSHRRSLSDRLLRMFQNYPCISPTC